MKYDFDKDALAVVLKKGPEIYFVDEQDQLVEVESTHERAVQRDHGWRSAACGRMSVIVSLRAESKWVQQCVESK